MIWCDGCEFPLMNLHDWPKSESVQQSLAADEPTGLAAEDDVRQLSLLCIFWYEENGIGVRGSDLFLRGQELSKVLCVDRN